MTTSYSPQSSVPGSPLPGDDDLWAGATSVWENHQGVYVQHAPLIFGQSRAMTGTNVVEQEWLRWRLRGNLDLHPMRWRGYCTPSGGGTPRVLLRCGTATAAANVSGTGWLDVDVTPVAGGVQDCIMYGDASGVGVTLDVAACMARLVPSSRTTKQASGWIGDDEEPDAADAAVNIEYLDRLERGPLLIARDRPHCVTAVNPKIATSYGAKSITDWLGGNSSSTDIVGHALMPKVDDRPRRFIVDCYVAQSAAGTCVAELSIGSWRWQIPATGSWQSAEVVLPPEPLPIVASVTASGLWAQFQGVQVWRI